MRLNFRVEAERIEVLKASTAFLGLAKSRKKGALAQAEIESGQRMQQSILTVLRGIQSDKLWLDRAEFTKDFDAAFKAAKLKLTTPLRKGLIAALCERDETAAVCADSKGKPEPDSELRDFENIPLKEDVDAYFAREVLPHVPDAWIDHEKTKVGYEIPFAKHFYEYKPMRPLEEIKAEILALEERVHSTVGGGLRW